MHSLLRDKCLFVWFYTFCNLGWLHLSLAFELALVDIHWMLSFKYFTLHHLKFKEFLILNWTLRFTWLFHSFLNQRFSLGMNEALQYSVSIEFLYSFKIKCRNYKLFTQGWEVKLWSIYLISHFFLFLSLLSVYVF